MSFRIPDGADATVGYLEQKSMCLDTLGNNAGKSVGLYICHHAGGNQVRITILSSEYYYNSFSLPMTNCVTDMERVNQTW